MRMDDTLIGPTVGAAKALLEQAAPGEILVLDATRRAVEPSFEVQLRHVKLADGEAALAWSVVRRAPPLRFPGAETMLVEDEEADDSDRDGDDE